MNSAVEKRSSLSGHVDVWYCFTDDARLNSKLAQYEAMLSPAEQQQYQLLMHGSNDRDYLVSRALLRTVLFWTTAIWLLKILASVLMLTGSRS